MNALIFLEAGDELIFQMQDMRKMNAIFNSYDFENQAIIAYYENNLEAFEINEIRGVFFSKPIEDALMINAKLALSQQTVDRWRDSHRIKSGGSGVNLLVGNGVLTASTNAPIAGVK